MQEEFDFDLSEETVQHICDELDKAKECLVGSKLRFPGDEDEEGGDDMMLEDSQEGDEDRMNIEEEDELGSATGESEEQRHEHEQGNEREQGHEHELGRHSDRGKSQASVPVGLGTDSGLNDEDELRGTSDDEVGANQLEEGELANEETEIQEPMVHMRSVPSPLQAQLSSEATNATPLQVPAQSDASLLSRSRARLRNPSRSLPTSSPSECLLLLFYVA